MQKRGQITVFIIIGLIILASMLAFYYAGESVETAKLETNLEISQDFESNTAAVQSYVQDCVERVSTNSVILLGIQGGFLNEPFEYVQMDDDFSTKIGYSYNKAKTMRSLGQMQQDIGKYFDDTIDSCINLSIFPGMEFEKGKKQSIVLINYNDVIFNVKYPLTMKMGDQSTTISSYQYVVPINLGYVHDYVNRFIDQVVENPKWINYTYLTETDLDTMMLPIDFETLFITVFDTSSNVRQFPFVYTMALKFDRDVIEEAEG